jgi:hypothetical protein
MGWQDAPVVNGWQSAPVVEPPSGEGSGALGTLRDVAAGAVRGAGSIGSTLLAPYDMARDALAGKGLSLESNRQRRNDIDAGLATLTGADTSSLAYSGGKLGAEIAGTMGVGGALANGFTRFAPGVAAQLPTIVQSLKTAGFSTGGVQNMPARILGGAVTGGAAAGLVNPEDAPLGAAIGGALPVGIKAAGIAGDKVAKGVTAGIKNTLGLTTGVGAEPVSQAFKAGRSGNTAFLDNMRGNVPLDDVLATAKSGLEQMRAAKSAQYRSGMIPISGDKTTLVFDDVERAFQKAANVVSYKGQVKNESAATVLEKMRATVDEWRQLNPAEFHTPEGMDALKQKLGAIMESIPANERGAKLAAGKVYNATKSTIEQQAPTYAKVMRNYSVASEQIYEIERALSLGDRASKDTAMRKLQSLMRNNVQTNYGNRLNLANTLESQGGVEIMPSLAGQAMSSLTPRSLSGQIGGLGSAAMMLHNPLMATALPFQSPRVVGEAAYKLGKMASAGSNAAQPVLSRAPSLLNAPDDLLQLVFRGAPLLAGNR